jgi:predicted RNA-binding Zn-ribbon protein involved in translation (DUF1610 family)
MREVTIQCGVSVTVKAEWIERPCPFCGTRVRSGEQHHCKLGEPTRRRPTRQPHKGAK